MTEEWRKIQGFENYEVSNTGKVRSINWKGQGITKELYYSCNNGYIIVRLFKSGKGNNMKVHRLVATAFIDNPKNYKEVNHIDGKKSNNCVTNLEWCTNEYNIRHAVVTGLKQKRNQTQCHRIIVHEIATGNETEFQSIGEAAQTLQIDSGNISKCLKGKRKHAKGYRFRLKEESC